MPPPLHHCVPTSCPSQARHVWSSMARACHGFSVPPDSPLAFSPFRLGLDRCQLDVKTFDRTMDDYVRAHLQLVVDLWGAGAGAAMAPWTVLISFLRTLPSSSGRSTHTNSVEFVASPLQRPALLAADVPASIIECLPARMMISETSYFIPLDRSVPYVHRSHHMRLGCRAAASGAARSARVSSWPCDARAGAGPQQLANQVASQRRARRYTGGSRHARWHGGDVSLAPSQSATTRSTT